MTASGTFMWRGEAVPFREGQSIASALAGLGIHGFGVDPAGGQTRYFCGIGACQCCLVRIDGRVREACLEPAAAGMTVSRLEDSHAW
ncbi:(2Fe-2S)-binding protein (plasmid) [Rhizobium sp. WL3]|jgi:predicted molibdopterin-dependent oxidoreductase YjgC|uniref:2Fe-2S iron-sulfur cluster-binding protein n=1 Tax=Rhizobium sp. WL3 TaxID=2603277 RepID=UPI0011C1F910|nr:2Fe-2S iron-sulfur cluster-binding protein [Rhizobium sp. WL3]QEE43487.1 (2Fe-2S)-binding protein [Rhizobium sp. WL3]